MDLDHLESNRGLEDVIGLLFKLHRDGDDQRTTH